MSHPCSFLSITAGYFTLEFPSLYETEDSCDSKYAAEKGSGLSPFFSFYQYSEEINLLLGSTKYPRAIKYHKYSSYPSRIYYHQNIYT
jgi:hypothetical protein